jgi:feruloyl esterase
VGREGSAPNYIIATHLTNNTIDRTRPLCPYPKIARWNGSASSDDAKNFTCVEAGSAASNRKVKK